MNILRVPRPGQRIRLPGPAKDTARPRQADHSWFWEVHQTARSAGSPRRWRTALDTVLARRLGGKGIVSDATAAKIARTWRSEIAQAARHHQLSEALLVAVIAIESNGNAKATSPKGAQGLMQLIPATAARFGLSNAYDPAENISGGAAYLDWLLKRFDGDLLLALAGYNAGEGAVDKHHGVPPYAETRDYVVKVMDALAAAQGVCDRKSVAPRLRCGWTVEAEAERQQGEG